ncbi:GDP-mannose transporter into the lumen of the Golgi [Balamuthia mandrillaris]
MKEEQRVWVASPPSNNLYLPIKNSNLEGSAHSFKMHQHHSNKRWNRWLASFGGSAVLVPILSCLCYSASSMLMTLSNKYILSVWKFEAPVLLVLYQSCFTLGLTLLCHHLGFLQLETLKLQKLKKWIPVNLFFVLMLLTAQSSLGRLSVAMVTIFKNFTTIAITLGDRFFFYHSISTGVAASLVVMFLGSVVAGFNDLEFNAVGYFYMLLNCASQCAYVLSMKRAQNLARLDPFNSVYYNNVLSVPSLLLLLVLQGELSSSTFASEAFQHSSFYLMLIANGGCGFAISMTCFWAIQATSPTTYSVVGALNKIPLTIIGSILFGNRFTTMGAISIFVGLSGGVIYAWAKAAQQIRQPKQQQSS